MKKIVFLFIVIPYSFLLKATIWTVDNKINSGAQFSDLQEAINNASAGDTLYIAASPDSYGDAEITKKLALIGAGYMSNTQNGYVTIVDDIDLIQGLDEFNNPVSFATECYISGISFSVRLSNFSIKTGTNHLIERCYNAQVLAREDNTSVTIRNCILQAKGGSASVDLSTPENSTVIVQNSIITGGIIVNAEVANVLVDHCIFTNDRINHYSSRTLRHVTITNSIMYGIATDEAEYVTFTNNMSIGGSFTDFIYGTNTGGSNYPDTNPEFTTIDGINFSFTDDFRLSDTSPAKGAASDGTDIGIYGGLYPFPIGGEGEYLMAAPPSIPQILEMNIQNASLPENSTLQVQIKSTVQN